VALKILETEDSRDALAARLALEARVLAKLEHPGIVPVHDAGTLADGRVFYVMKFVEGARLDKFLATVLSLSERLRLFLRICEALSFAHARGILHRDLKPANIMIGAFGEVLVMDWGLAKMIRVDSETAVAARDGETLIAATPASLVQSESTQATAVTLDGTVMGTPGYMSPEQASGNSGSIDERSDIFSLGRLLEFIATKSRDEIVAQPPKSLRAIWEKASANEPGIRYPRVSDLAEDVRRFLDGQPVSAYRENGWERTQRFYNRYRAAILLITVYLAVRILFVLYPRH
jgi:serine/threonine protein kinase